MVKLYYTPTSCGAASFISAFKAGLHDIQTEQVSLADHKTASGVDFYTINPKGNVPCLVLDDGTILNENAAVLQYIADLDPTHSLAPPNGTKERYQLQALLSYVGSELHAQTGPLFNPNIPHKDFQIEVVKKKLAYINDNLLNGKRYLLGNSFTVADAYLYLVAGWGVYFGVDLAQYPNIQAYLNNLSNEDFVVKAKEAMQTSPSHI